MNFPFTVDNRSPNNALMKDNSPYDYDRAFRQWLTLYEEITDQALVYLLPHDNTNLQDLPYVANLGAWIPNSDNTILLANFKSRPRQPEELVGMKFFMSMGYWTLQPPYDWEGEADLKYVKGNTFISGYGIRSDLNAYHWMQDTLDMKIIPVKMTDEKLYHFDCVFFPITEEKALAATSVLSPEDVKLIEREVEIIDVPKKYIYDGWTNAVRLDKRVLVNDPPTKESRDVFEDLMVDLGFDPVIVNLSEFDKSGADLSCLCLHLNFEGRNDDPLPI